MSNMVTQQQEIARLRAEVERLTREKNDAVSVIEIHAENARRAGERMAEMSVEFNRLRADARLGAMVRRMPNDHSLERQPGGWFVIKDALHRYVVVTDGGNPEEALEKAGCGEAEP